MSRDVFFTFDPQRAEWDEMVEIWDWTATSPQPDVTRAVERMRDAWERFEEEISDLGSPELLARQLTAWALESKSCVALLSWKNGTADAAGAIAAVETVTKYYEKTIVGLGGELFPEPEPWFREQARVAVEAALSSKVKHSADDVREALAGAAGGAWRQDTSKTAEFMREYVQTEMAKITETYPDEASVPPLDVVLRFERFLWLSSNDE